MKSFKERYKRIAESKSFIRAYQSMTIGEMIPLHGEFLEILNNTFDRTSKSKPTIPGRK